MKVKPRYLTINIQEDLKDKMVVKKCRNERIHKGIRVMPVDKFLTAFI